MAKLANAAKFLLFTLLIAISFYGIDAPEDRISQARVKQFMIQNYKYGITISNDNKNFYNITPLNFYFEVFGNKRTLLNTAEEVVNKELEADSKLERIFQSFLNSLKLNKIVATIKTSDSSLTLEGKVAGNTLNTMPTINDVVPTGLVQAVTYNKTDLVFDEKMEIYTPLDSSVIDEINSFYGTGFKNESDSPEVTGNSVYITDLENPGVIEVTLQNKTARVDKERMVIEIRTSDNQNLKLNFYNNLTESLGGLR